MDGREIVASTSDIGFFTDREGVIRGWNEAAEECFDIAADRSLGERCWEVLQGRDAFGNEYCGPHCPLMRMALQGKPVQRCQLAFLSADGIRRPYSVLTLLLRGEEAWGAAVVHFIHPALWDRRCNKGETASLSSNRDRGELTPRELEIMTLLGKGRNTAEIAGTLRISAATASNHIQHILFKLNVHSRLEAVAVGRKAGLL